MILYNVTINIDQDVHREWLEWMRSEHIPEVLATGCFTEARLSRIQAEEDGGVSFSVMYFSPSKELHDQYQKEFAPVLQRKHSEKYQGKFAAFRTILDVIEEFR